MNYLEKGKRESIASLDVGIVRPMQDPKHVPIRLVYENDDPEKHAFLALRTALQH